MKRPALRGDVIRAGVTCDARLLSCSFFEPSALPLPWAFCRSQTRQSRALSGKRKCHREAGRFPSLPAFFCVAHECFKGQNRALRQLPTKAPISCFNPSEVYGCYQSRRRSTNCFTTRNKWSHSFGLRFEPDQPLLADRVLLKKSMATPATFEIFWGALFDG